ncbi:ribosomal L1 domain-containing protein 1-like [Glandiceps talaboti]
MATVDHVDVVEASTLLVDKHKVLKAIQALYKQHELQQAKRKSLLGDSQKVFLQLALWKVPVQKNERHRISIPHAIHSKRTDVCLITKDERNMDRDQSGRFYENLLAEKGVKNITHVMSLQKLRKEYRPYQIRRDLVRMYDIFLADARIFRLLDTCTGKEFHRKNKYPIAVNLTKTDLAGEINKAVNSTYFTLIGRGSSSTFVVASTDMSENQVADNVMAAVEGMMTYIPMGWHNIKCLYIKTERSLAIPVYATLECKLPITVRSPKNKKPITESEAIQPDPEGSGDGETGNMKRKQTTDKQTVTKKMKTSKDKSTKPKTKKEKLMIEKKTKGKSSNNKAKKPKSKVRKVK